MRPVLLIIGVVVGLVSIPLVVLGTPFIPQLLFDRRTVEVTIPEGMTLGEINALLKEKKVIRDEELDQGLEGYLFPDTYEFFAPSSLEEVRAKFEMNFEAKVKPVIPPEITETELKQAIIVASLIEKEVSDPADRKLISGIIWKRLRSDVPLQVDWSICYSKDRDPCLPISEADKQIDSPYNTYLYRGLPPGPIANPGLDAILASLNPVRSPYWYYLSDPKTDKTIFSKTLDEHNQNIIKYLGE